MRLFCKITLLAAIFFAAFDCSGQVQRSSPAVTVQDNRLQALLNFKVPVVNDTASALNGGLDSLGLIVQIRATGDWYKRDTSIPYGHKWTKVGAGNLSPSDTTGKWFSWGYRSHDSVYFCKNTTCTFIYKDSVGGGGTDSAIAALYGLKEIISGTTRYFYVDSFAVESRQRGLKIADSLTAVFNASLALKKDKADSAINSASYTTRGWLYHVIDSLSGITDFTDYHSTGATGIPLLVVSTSGSHTGVNIPKIRDSTVTTIAGDSGVTIATHDSVGANALQTKYRTDTMRNRIDTALDNKMRNYGGAPGQLQGTYAGIPAATSYPNGMTYIAQDSGFHYVDTGSGASRGWKRINGSGSGGGGTIGGTASSGQVAYGSATNMIKTESPFTYNETTNKLNSDSIQAQSIFGDASALTTNQFPFRLQTGYGGYSGLLVKNMSTSGAGATQLKITTASEKGGFLFNVLGDNWPGANATPVLRIFGNQPFVQAADSADFIWEQGTPGVSAQEWMHYFYNPAYQNASLLVGNVLPFPADYRNHGTTLFVYGSAKIMSGLTLNDAGQHYYVIRGGNFHDSINYQGGVGAEIRGAIVSQPDNPLMRLDSVGRARLYFYNNSNPAQAISTKALLVDNSGNVKLGGVYDTASGTQNGTAVLYWGPNGYPTSSDSKLSFNYNTNVLDVRSTAGGMLKADSAALYHGYLRLADYGGTYAYVAADNFQLRPTYVEGVNLRFRVVNSTNPRLDAFEIDSTGDIRWLVQPKSATSADSVMMIASNGIVHRMRIADLGALISSTNIYNTDGTLTGNRVLTGSSHDLTFSGLGSFGVSGNTASFTSMIASAGNTANSTSFTWPSNRSSQILQGGLTSDQTVTMPTGVTSGSILFLTNDNVSTNGFKWLISGTVTDGSGSSMAYFRNSTSYILQAESGSAWRVIASSGDVTGVIESSAASITPLGGNSYYVFNGSTSTWTLPSLSGNQGRVYRLKNAGSGNLTIAVSGSDNIYDTSGVTTLTITPGSSRVIVAGSSFWYAE